MSSVKADARVVQTVRTLKEHPTVKESIRNNINLEKILDKNQDINLKEEKRKGTVILRNIKPIKKFSIDGAENNINNNNLNNNNINNNLNNNNINNNKENKLNDLNLKERLSQSLRNPINFNIKNSINLNNGFRKGKSKYIQSLLSDTSMKKYKQTCITFLKEDELIKKLYEENGFEKTNFSYDNFLEKYFFNSKLFLFKLEINIMSEDFTIKKNTKEKFFKKEIINFLKKMKDDKSYNDKKNNLKQCFDTQFSFIKNFDLFQ